MQDNFIPEEFQMIGKRIKEIREQNHLTQSALAEAVNVSVPYISYIETGKKKINLKVLINMINMLGITANEIFYGVQKYDNMEYEIDIHLLLSDCTFEEKHKLYKIMKFHKEILRQI